MMKRKFFRSGVIGTVALLACMALSHTARAVQPDEVLSDPKLEERARGISAELRCMVCQNQSIDDSNAPLARDLRLLVREQLMAGKSDDEIMSYLVERYGAFVLLKPPFEAATLVLWLSPVLVLLAGGLVLLYRVRRAPKLAVAPLSAEEQQRIRDLAGKS
jgi:cytochrome c-type biogenesis protein CcmH